MDILEKLEQTLEYEFYSKRRKMNSLLDKKIGRLYIHIPEVKEEEDLYDFIDQLKKDIAEDAMKKVDAVWYKVKQLNKKRKLNLKSEPNEQSQPTGLSKCSKE